MSDDMILHFSSNSSNQSDQSSKIAKLEARLVGKASSAVSAQPQVPVQLNSWTTPAKFGGASGGLPHSLVDSDDSDDDDHENLCPQNQRLCLRSISNEMREAGFQMSLVHLMVIISIVIASALALGTIYYTRIKLKTANACSQVPWLQKAPGFA